ncbi:hypothetical protein VTN00DRAFT_1635 [Thermoascus crustaceus]|uniref:uncharacterized protein n=1 Tax=Thermoascus crustaceus TaxID=5088 RepID=UPI0037449004
MLKPFQIRDLHSPPPEKNASDSVSASNASSEPQALPTAIYDCDRVKSPVHSSRRHGIVQLSAPQYDEIVSSHPRARLMYMDDDDGEIITVGSSIELSQRLDEPANAPAVPRSPSPARDDSSPMHVFDIRRSNSVTELWKRYETRPAETFQSSERPKSPIRQTPMMHDASENTADAGQETGDGTDSKKKAESIPVPTFENLRELWFRACNPPHLGLTELSHPEIGRPAEQPVSSTKPDAPSPATRRENGSTAERNPASNIIEFGLNTAANITAEGRRQAQEAGARLRGLRDLSAGASSLPFPIPSFENTPWASYMPGEAELNNLIRLNLTTFAERKRQLQESLARLHEQHRNRLAAFSSIRHGEEVPLASLLQGITLAGNSVETGRQEGSSEAVEPGTKDEGQPLLAAFEAELAKMMEASGSSDYGTPQSDTSTFSAEEAATSERNRPPKPVELLVHALQNLVSGVELFGSELRSRVPEIEHVERQLSQIQRALPEQLGTTLQSAFTALESRIKNLAKALHDASVATGCAADRVRQTEIHPAAEQAAEGLRTLAGEISQISRTLFAAFEAELGRRTSDIQNESCTQNAPDASQPETQPHVSDCAEDSTTDGPASDTVNQKPKSQSDESKNDNGTLGDAATASQTEKPDPPEQLTNENVSTNTDRGEATRSLERPVGVDASSPKPIPPPCYTNMPKPWNWEGPLFRRPHWPSHTHQGSAQPPLHRPCAPEGHSAGHVPPPDRRPRSLYDEYLAQHQLNQPTPQSAKETLFIGNVGFNVTEKTIRDVFASKGFLANVHLPVDSTTGKHAGFGYVHFPSSYAATAALAALQGALIDGHSINLEFSDHCPINALQTPPKVPNGTRPMVAPDNPGRVTMEQPALPHHHLRHRQSWHPTNGMMSEQTRMNRPNAASSDGNSADQTPKGKDTTTTPPKNQNEVSVLDQTDDDTELSARYPSLLSAGSQCSVTTNATSFPVPGDIPTPDSIMARFPPVSQLDAHILTSQQRFAHTKPRPSTGTQQVGGRSNVNPGPSELGKKDVEITPNAPPQTIPGSFSQGMRVECGTDQLRRSNTVVATDPAAGLTGPFDPFHRPGRPLRRSATERDPLRQIRENHANRRSRLADTIRPSPLFGAPPNTRGSFPVNNPPHNREARPTPCPVVPPRPLSLEDERGSDDVVERVMRRSAIENCVATLLSLGYGGASDGGRQRITVYAEAAKGRVSDAIDMIEEERKAYAQQHR